MGAILFVNVPATIIKSEWRGLARNRIPNLSKSYRLMAECIISTAQQASPNVSGHREPARDQPTNVCNFVTNQSNLIKTYTNPKILR